MKAIPIILAPMERYYFDPERGIMYKNCTIEKNGKSYTFDEDGVYTTVSAANKKK